MVLRRRIIMAMHFLLLLLELQNCTWYILSKEIRFVPMEEHNHKMVRHKRKDIFLDTHIFKKWKPKIPYVLLFECMKHSILIIACFCVGANTSYANHTVKEKRINLTIIHRRFTKFHSSSIFLARNAWFWTNKVTRNMSAETIVFKLLFLVVVCPFIAAIRIYFSFAFCKNDISFVFIYLIDGKKAIKTNWFFTSYIF